MLVARAAVLAAGLTLAYPQARRVEQVDVYHGVRVADPYRWMEDLASPATIEFARAQDALTRQHVAGSPAFEAFRARLLELMGAEVVGVPMQAGGRLFFTRTPRGPSSRPIVSVLDPRGPEPRTLVDSNTFAEGETLGVVLPSRDGKALAFGVSRPGSSWFELRFLDVERGRPLPDRIEGLNRQAGVSWARDGAGVYYSAFAKPAAGQERTAPLRDQKLYRHRLGTKQGQDALLLSEPSHPERTFAALETEDGLHLVVTVREGSSVVTWIRYRPLRGDRPFVPVAGDGSDANTFRGSDGSTFWIQTNAGAPRGRLVAVDVRRPGREHWRDVIAESSSVLNFVNLVADRFVAMMSEDARQAVKVFDLSGRFEREVKLPDLGSTFSGFVGRRRDPHAYFAFNAAAHPPGASVLRLDPRTGAIEPFRRPTLGFEPGDYETRQVFFNSKDGTRIPMFVASRKGLKLDGSHRALLYAYGAGSWHAIPWFQPQVLAWMEAGGVYALANVRGGGEYGESWHQAGIGRRKQNAIDDLAAAAEHLVSSGYTSSSRLVLNGGSLSGPLAGALLTQRPELFAAAVIDIPALDMLRYDRFTGGAGWRNELGSPGDPEDFRALFAYSPYHNLKPGTCYPPTLITAGERDETAVPSHAYKFIAALQQAQGCSHPALLQVLWGAGHTLGTTREQSAAAFATQLAFLDAALGPAPNE
jgi:prolyl oligopeptidase